MSDDLRDRIAEVMRRAEGEWWREEDSQTDVDSHVAQAVIDGLGLEVVSDGGRPEWKLQIVGKWEPQA